MLSEFLAARRDAVIDATRRRVAARRYPAASPAEIEHGVPLFLTQLEQTLRLETATTPSSDSAIGASAVHHGRELLALGFSLSEVVHDYGDICQSVMEVASADRFPISTEEFRVLNRSLDTAIAEAVAEHARLSSATRETEEVERLGRVAHEIRDMLTVAIFAFDVLRKGSVGINGSTGALLGRSLTGLRDFVDSTLAEVRVDANQQRRVRVQIAPFLNDLAVAGGLQADYRQVQFAMPPVDSTLAADADPQLLGSAVMSLLNNAFKFTPKGGEVILRARAEGGRLVIEVQDQCGGIPPTSGDPFKPFGERRGSDRTGLGLGLSIARKAVRAQGGDIRLSNMPGTGCVFAIELPLAGPLASPEAAPLPTA